MASLSIDDLVKTFAITSTVPVGKEDCAAMLATLLPIDALKPGVALSGSILTVTLNDGRVLNITVTSDGQACTFSMGALAGHVYVLTAAGNANGVYTGTISKTANALAGIPVEITGFTTSANNGAFLITANNGSTTITTSNASSASETHAGTATVTTLTEDKWAINDLVAVLKFVQAAVALIQMSTATVFTVTYDS